MLNIDKPEFMFVKLDNSTIRLDTIEAIYDSQIENWFIVVKHKHGEDTVSGFFAVELLWLLKPSALEGKRLFWKKNIWIIHNILAHPLMQILAFFKCYKLAMWIHDSTVPKPIEKKKT